MKAIAKSAVKTKRINVLGPLETLSPYEASISEFSSPFAEALDQLGNELVTTATTLEQKGNTAVVARIFREYETSIDVSTPSTDFRPLVDRVLQSAKLLLTGSSQKQLVVRARKVSSFLHQDGRGPTHVAEHIELRGVSVEALGESDDKKQRLPLIIVLDSCDRSALERLARVLPETFPADTLIVKQRGEPDMSALPFLDGLVISFSNLGGWVAIEGQADYPDTIREFINQV